MSIVRKNNLNVRKTVKKAVNNHPEFHFFVDELTSDNCMPTYAGMADEKYTFDEMDDDFFEFIDRKISENGIYLRICYMMLSEADGEAIFVIEIAGREFTFKTDDLSSVQIVEMADYGIKIESDRITYGTTVEGGCVHTPYFAEFGSKRGNETYLSLENPLNRFIISLIDEFLE